MPTAKPRLQVTLRMPTYLLLTRLAKLRGCSRAQIVSEFVEEVAPVLQRVAALMEQAQGAHDWAKAWRADLESVQRKLEDTARVNLDLFESVGSLGGERSELRATPERVTRGSESRKPLRTLKTGSGARK